MVFVHDAAEEQFGLARKALPQLVVEIGKFLKPGDVIELELEGVGTLRTPISTERQKAPWWPEPRTYPHEEWVV